MIPLLDLVRIVLESILQTLAEPWSLLPMAVVLLLIGMQYRRAAALERALFGTVLHSPFDQLLTSLWVGLGGGLVATLLFLCLGISLPETGLLHVWVLALILMLIHPRFICFAYAGGIVALSSLLFDYPQVHVGGIMGLVAVLHLVEAVLIRLTGARGATPVFVRHTDGRVVGGFAMQRFWPVPFFAVLGLLLPEGLANLEAGVAMPDWWPLIGTENEVPAGMQLMYYLLPVAAALGYGDLAVTQSPEEKARRTSNHLFAYSLVLLALAILATQHRLWAYVAALFSPLAHEWVIRVGQRSERTGEPVFTNARGPMVMATVPGSPAESMGLRAGDIIHRVNGYWVRTGGDVLSAITPWSFGVEMLVEATDGTQRVARYEGKVPPLGLILAPDEGARSVVRFGRLGPLGRFLRGLRTRFSE